MFNIGYVDTAEQKNNEYLDYLKKNSCNVFELSLPHLKSTSQNIDVILIFDISNYDIEKVCRYIMEIRKFSDAVLWVISPKSNSISRIIYLQLGADISIGEQYTVEEVQMMLQRFLNNRTVSDRKEGYSGRLDVLESERIELNITNRSVCLSDGREVHLTNSEFKILELLYRKKGNAVTYEEIYHANWIKPCKNQKMRVANVIFHLREKIEEDAAKPVYIKTIRSKGYLLEI